MSRSGWWLVLLLVTGAARAEMTAGDDVPGNDAGRRAEWRGDLDAYTSRAGLLWRFSARPAPDGERLSEFELYRQLFRDSLRPRTLFLSVAANPVAAGATWLRRNHPGGYEDFRLGDLGGEELNLLDAVSAGYQEPAYVQLFVGTDMSLGRYAETSAWYNRGYMGYELSAGAKHIRNNNLIDDDWWQFDWKLDGNRESEAANLDWSFRLGVRNHRNPWIDDVVRVAVQRSRVDWHGPVLSWFHNSSLSLLTEVSRHTFDFMRQEIIVGKAMPLSRWRAALSVDLGVVVELDDKYSGPLSDPAADQVTFVLRPRLDF